MGGGQVAEGCNVKPSISDDKLFVLKKLFPDLTTTPNSTH